MATVTFEHLTKRYGDVEAVHELDLAVAEGEFLVLVGPSGCGKSTALRCTAGFEEISEGNLLIGDRPVNDVAPQDRDIAMVFQNYALYPHMSVSANLAFGLKLRKTPKAEITKRVNEVAEMLDLGALLRRKPGQLSGGQRQRVALGRAIVREPAVFLMDEPLSNLDAQLRVATRAELVRLHQRLQTTTLYVTHDQVEAMTMGARIALLREGVLQQVGTPRDLYERPVNVFAAGFIGSPAMNFFTGEIAVDGGVTRVELEGLSLTLQGAPAALARRHSHASVIVGFRPEHLRLSVPEASGEGPVAHLRVSAEVVEYLGDDELVHAKVADRELLALVSSGRGVVPGDVLDLAVPMGKIHLFDAATQDRITFDGQSADGASGLQEPAAGTSPLGDHDGGVVL